MAITKLTTGITEIIKENLNSGVTLNAGEAMNATDGNMFEANYHDDHFMIIAQNTVASAKTLVIKGGTHESWGGDDLSISIPASTTKVIMVDSIRFKILQGADKGYIKLTGPADIKLQVIKFIN